MYSFLILMFKDAIFLNKGSWVLADVGSSTCREPCLSVLGTGSWLAPTPLPETPGASSCRWASEWAGRSPL